MGCKIRDLDVYCEVIGEGKPVVMVHGMGVDHRTMKGCMEPIFQNRSDPWQRIYFDLPGMGKTNGADWIANSDDMYRFVLALIDEIIPHQSFLIVGESYGGYLVRAVVRERPAVVEGMLLIGPLVVANDKRRDVSPCSVFMRDAVLEKKLDEEERHFLDLFLVNQTAANWERFQAEMLAGFECADPGFNARVRGDIASYAFTFDVDELAAPFEKPSLMITGRQDCLTGYRDAWKLLPNYPRSSFVVLDMAGHGMQIDQASLFNSLVNEWLDRVAGKQVGR
jgi:pimeloyl-ACP methyl ester carboxylesterase